MRTRRAALSGALPGMAAAAWPALAFAQEHAAEGGGNPIFAVNPGLMIWTWVLFGLTLAILAWKVFPAISGGLEERHAKIQGAIDEARLAREEAEALRAEQRTTLDAARAQAQETVEKARASAEGLKKEILAEAREQQTALLADARRDLELERDQLREDIRKEAVDIALSAAERLLRTRLDGEENRRLVSQYVSDL